MNLSREFAAPWPAVLVEMKDFVDLARLFVGDDKVLFVRVVVSKTTPAEWLYLPSFQEFRATIEAIPRVKTLFIPDERTCHRIDIEIQR